MFFSFLTFSMTFRLLHFNFGYLSFYHLIFQFSEVNTSSYLILAVNLVQTVNASAEVMLTWECGSKPSRWYQRFEMNFSNLTVSWYSTTIISIVLFIYTKLSVAVYSDVATSSLQIMSHEFLELHAMCDYTITWSNNCWFTDTAGKSLWSHN